MCQQKRIDMKKINLVMLLSFLVIASTYARGGSDVNEFLSQENLSSEEDGDETIELDAGEKVALWKEKVPFDFGMSVDVYTQTNFAGKQTNDIVNESFSNVANSFELGMINMMIGKNFGKVGFMADLGFGPRANAANGIDVGSIATIKQLYVSYAPCDAVEFTFGNFSTFFGWELIEPQNNFHYSTSLGFQNGPFYHTGLKANFTKEKFNFLVGVFNDTDTKSDGDRNKFVGAQMGYSGDKFSTYLNFVGGNTGAIFDEEEEPTMLFSKNYKTSIGSSSVLTVGAEGGGSIVLDLAYHRLRMKDAVTDGISNPDYFIAYLYGQAPVKENGAIGARVGYANNNEFVIGDSKHFTDFTLTYNQKIAGLLTLVPEFKVDYATDKVFVNNKGNASNTQFRLMLAAIFAI